MTDLKNIDILTPVKWIYKVRFEDGTTGILEINPIKYKPIIDGKMCTACNYGHCLYYMFHEPDDCCPKNVIKITEDTNV